MIKDVRELHVTLQQIERFIRAIEDLRENVLPKDPQLFATLVEGPIDNLQLLRSEVHDFMHELQPTA